MKHSLNAMVMLANGMDYMGEGADCSEYAEKFIGQYGDNHARLVSYCVVDLNGACTGFRAGSGNMQRIFRYHSVAEVSFSSYGKFIVDITSEPRVWSEIEYTSKLCLENTNLFRDSDMYRLIKVDGYYDAYAVNLVADLIKKGMRFEYVNIG